VVTLSDLVYFTRQALTDVVNDLALDDAPTDADGDVLPVLEAALEVLTGMEAGLA
jgi:hypothetical protein